MATNAIKYLSNVGKSVAYSTIDQVKKMNPAITSFSSTNAETLRTTYDAITHLKQYSKKVKNNVLDSQYGKAAIKARDNLFEDIKTGKFYNRERINKAESEAADKLLNGDDFGFDFEFIDESSSDDDEMSTNDMLDLVAEKSSNAVSTAVARSAEYIVTANSQMNKSLYEQNKAIFSGLHSDISTMNDNIGKLIEFASNPLQTHVTNSTKYYETSTKLDQERNEILKEMLDLQREYYKPKETSSSKKPTSIMDLIDSEGMLDIAAFAKHIKERSKSKDGGMMDMVKMMFEMGGIDSIIASPLQLVTDAMANKLIPNILKDTMKSFNDSLSGLFTSAIAKLNNSDTALNPVLDFLKDLIGLDPSVKRTLDTSKYNKGAIPFDGVTKKAIVEVIPTYLSKILSVVSGTGETRYNYETGKFTNVKDIKSYLNSIEKDAARNAGYDIRDEISKYSSQIRFGSKKERDQFDKDLDAILEYSYRQGMLFNSKDRSKSARSYGLKGGEASEVNLEIFRTIMDKIPTSTKMGYASKMFQEKDNQNRRMQELEDSGIGIYTALFNESIKAIKEAGDEAAAAPGRGGMLNVLNNIYDEVRTIRELLGSGRGRGKKWRGKGPKSPTPGTPTSGGSGEFYDIRADKYALDYKDLKGSNIHDKLGQQIDLYNQEIEARDHKDTLVDKVLKSRKLSDNFKVIFNNLNELVHKPANILSGLIKKADLAIYNLIFGDEALKNKRESDIAEKGIGGYIVDQLKVQFNKFGEWVQKEVMYPVARFIDDIFNKKIVQKIGDFFGIDTENLGKSVREKLFGKKDEHGEYISDGLFGEQYRRFTAEFKKAGKYAKSSMGVVNDYFGFTKKYNESGRAKKAANDSVFSFIQALNNAVDKQPKPSKNDGVGGVENAAAGMKKVSKTGIIAASEGELIIPAELNPFNVAKNKRKENKAKNRFIDTYDLGGFIDGYAEGGNVSFSDYIQKILNSGDPDKIKRVTKALGNMKNQENIKNARNKLKGLFQGFTKDDYEEGRDKNLFEKSLDTLGEGFKKFANYVKDLTPDKKQQEEEKNQMLSSAFKEMKKFLPEMGSGAVIGAGVSLVTGLFGGPLVGAAVGSGISLIKNSKKVQTMLFGEEVVDDEGNKERVGGILPKKLTNAITNYMPAMAKGATAGAITSILPFVPGGPIAGILIGGSLGFVSQNEEIREKLFGKDTKLGKINEKIKKALPNMGAGMIAGLIAGPFGLVPNLVIGSAIGFATSTDKFKRFMFGYDDENGEHHDGAIKSAIDTLFNPIKEFALQTKDELKDWAKKYIMQPLKDAADPLRKQAELMFQSIAEGVTGALNKLFEDKFGAPFDKFLKDRIFKPVGEFVKNFAKGALAPVRGLVSLPFRAIGAIGDHYRTKQIQQGTADYMTAVQRNAFRNKKGRGIFNRRFGSGEAGKFTRYDEAIVNLQNTEGGMDTLNSIYESLVNVQDQDKAFSDVLNPAYKKFNENVRKNANLSYKDTNKIGKQLRKMVEGSKDPDEASAKINKYIAKLDLPAEEKRTIQEAANQYIASFKNYTENATTRDKLKAGIYAEISDMLGVNVTDKEAGRLAKLLKREIPDTKPGEKANEKAPVSEGTVQDAHEETIKHIIKIEKYLEAMSGLGSLNQDKVDSYAEEYGEDFESKDSKYRNRKAFFGVIKSSIKDAIDLIKYIDSLYEEAQSEGNEGFFRRAFGNKDINWREGDQYNTDGSKKSTAARDAWEKAKRGIDPRKVSPDGAGEVENAAMGMRRVKRTGVVAVSEGEMIVPKSLNPYDVARNTLNENIAKNRFYDSYGISGIKGYAEGGTINADDIDTDGITVDVLKSKIKNSSIGQKAKKAYYTFVNGKPLRFVRDRVGKLTMDTSDSDTKKNYKDIQEDDKERSGFFSTLSSITGGIGKKFKKMLGIGGDGDEENEEDDETNPIFSFLSKVVGGKSKVAKVATAAGLAIGAPILIGFWNDTVWPKLQPFIEPFVQNIKNALEGVWDNAKKWFSGDGEPTKDGYSAGFPGLVERLVKYWSSGMEVIFTKVLPKAVEVFVKCLPSILVGVGKGIVNGLGLALQEFLDAGKPSTDPDRFYKGFDFKPVVTSSSYTIGSGKTSNLIDDAWYSSGWDTDLSSLISSYNGTLSFGQNSSSDPISGGQYLWNNMAGTVDGTQYTANYVSGNYSSPSSSSIQTSVSKDTAAYALVNNNISVGSGTTASAEADIQTIDYGLGVYKYDASQLRGVIMPSGEAVPMTVDQLLSYEGVIGRVSDGETTIDVTGTTLLNYPELASQYGFVYSRLTDSELQAKREELGVNTKTSSYSVADGILAFAGKSFLRGDNRGGKAISKIGKNKILKHIPIVGKPLSGAATVIGKAAEKIGNAGKNILPSWMTGKTKKTAANAATDTATNAASKAASTASSFVDDVVDEYGNVIYSGRNTTANRLLLGVADDATETASSTAAKAAKAVDDKANEGIIKKILNKVTSGIKGFFQNNTVVNRVSEVLQSAGQFSSKKTAEKATKELAEKLSTKLTSTLGVNLAKKSGAALAKLTASVLSAGVVTAVMGVAAFIKGWNNVNDYLGIADDVNEPSLLMRLIGGVVAALNEVFCLGLVPIDIVVSIVLEICQQVPGLKEITSGIVEDREESAELTAKASEDIGFELSGVTEFNELRRNADKNKSWWRNNIVYKTIAGSKDQINIDENGNYVYTKGEDGIIQKAWSGIKKGASNAKNFVFGNKETGEKNMFGKIGNFIIGNKETGEKNIFGKAGDVVQKLPFAKAISNGVSEIGNWLGDTKDSILDIGSFAAESGSSVVNWIIHPSKDYEPPKLDEDDPLYEVKKGVNTAIRTIAFIPGLVIRLGYYIWDKGLKPIATGIGNVGKNAAGTVGNMLKKAWKGDIKGAFVDSSDYSNGDSTGVTNTISKVVNNAIKVPLAIPSLLVGGVGFVIRNFGEFVDGIKDIGSGLGGTIGNMMSKAWKGDVKGAFTESSDNTNSDNELVNKISSVINTAVKVPMAIPTLLTSGLGFVVKGVLGVLNGVKEVGSGLAGTAGNMMSKAWKGDIKGAFTESSDNANSDNELVNTISKIANNVLKVPMSVPTVISYGIGRVVDLFKSVFDTIKKATTVSSSDEEKIEKAQDGDLSIFSGSYWKNSTSETGFVGVLQNVTTYIQKVMNIPMALIGMIAKPFKKIVEKVKDFFGDIGEWWNDSILGKFFGSGSGSGLQAASSAATATEKSNGTFISQLDPQYANKKFNIPGDTESQTLADTGCGPASAAMVINSFRNTNKSKMNLMTAAKDAINYKAEDEGVTADYFGDTFRKHGLNTKYIMDSNPNTRAENIAASLYSNNKVVLMGQDMNNSSKKNSPFGPNAHYVVATGISPDGKYIYINDPESSKANIPYPSGRVLGSTQMGIAANAASGSGLTPKYRKILQKYNGRGTEEVEKAVWNGLRSAGYNEIATAAAMGNIKHESGFNPSLIEGGSGIGFGLVQWSYGRRTAYENYASSKGKPASDLNTQIEYLLIELQANSGVWTKASSRYGFGSLTRDDWANGTNIDTATKAFMCCFERPSYSSSVNHIDRRLTAAREYLQKYSGTAVTGSTSSSDSSGGNVISTILDTISVFDDLAAAYGLTSKSDDNSSGTTSVGGTTGGTAQQNALVDKMKSIQGTLTYSQSARNPDNGSGDCSSTVQWAYKNVLGIDPGSWTGAQMSDPDTYTVTTSFDESQMQPGDLILYNGHVEMYAGNGQMIGHGGPGKGPTLKPLDDQGRFKMVRRWTGFKNASGSGLTDKYLDKSQLKDIKNINWIENNMNSVKDKSSVFWDNKYDKQAAMFSAGSSGTTNGYIAPGRSVDVVDVSGTVKTMQSGGADASIQALVAIIKLLSKVVDNTSTLQTIVGILGEIINIMNEQSQLSQTQANEQQAQILQTRKENLLTTLRSSTSKSGSGGDPALEQLVANVERLAMA